MKAVLGSPPVPVRLGKSRACSEITGTRAEPDDTSRLRFSSCTFRLPSNMALPHSSALLLETGIRHEDDDCDCGCGSDGRILSGGGSGTRRRCRAWSIVWRRRARTDRGRCRRRGGLHRWSCDLPFVGAATVQDDTPRTVLRQAGNAATLRPQQQSALRKKSGSRAGRSATEAGSAHSTCSHSSCSAGSRLRVKPHHRRCRVSARGVRPHQIWSDRDDLTSHDPGKRLPQLTANARRTPS